MYKMKTSYKQIANDLNLWSQYICGDTIDQETNSRWFNSLTEQERIDYIVTHWGKDLNDKETSQVWRHIFEDFSPANSNFAEELNEHSNKEIPLDICKVIETEFHNVYCPETNKDEYMYDFLDQLQGIVWTYDFCGDGSVYYNDGCGLVAYIPYYEGGK